MFRRSLPYAALLVATLALVLPNRAAAQFYPPPPPYAPPPYPPPYAPPPPPMGGRPMAPEYGRRLAGHSMFVLEAMPLADFGYNLGPGPESDLGYGVSLAAGYTSFWGLGVEAKVGMRRHSSFEVVDAVGNGFNFTQTVIPISGGFRYDFAHFWGGGALAPFLAMHFGTGGYYYSDDTAPNGFKLHQWTFMFDVGAGFDVWVTDYVGLGLGYWFEYYNNIDDITINALAIQLTL